MSKSITTDRHANARDRKRRKEREMVVSGRSVFLLQAINAAKAEEARRNAEARAKEAEARAKGRRR